MKFRFAIVENSLNRAQRRWKWLRFLQFSFILGSTVCLLAILFDVAVHYGLLVSKPAAIAFWTILLGAGFIAWLVLLILVVATGADRNWLAAALERVDRRFLDRLNTLLFLEQRRAGPQTDSFALRIAQQTRDIFVAAPPRRPFSGRKSGALFLAFVLLLAATLGLYHSYSPWPLLVSLGQQKPAPLTDPNKQLELALPATNNVEQNKDWGEVRITDPAADLKVTKVDVVPLQIEAAANQALQRVAWASTINGAPEESHALPAPAEPRYAVYQPTLYLDELQLSDWDIMTYYAKANTEKDNSFASEVYFLEVRPFREDILKMPGGENGKAYRCLSDMTALINRQQHVIRQTHQHIQKPPAQENLQTQDRNKLSEAEGDLRDSTEHLYARMAAEMENAPIGVALDNLAKAGKSLDSASGLLKRNSMPEAPNAERDALTDLVAARKMFQKAVCDKPSEFGSGEKEEEEPPKFVVDEARKLQKMAEFRNEAQAGRQFVQKTLEQQRLIEQQAKTAFNPKNLPGLSRQERQLQKSLEEFQEQHPRLFQGADQEFREAQDALAKAAEAMQNKSKDAQASTERATKELQKFSDAMNGQSAGQQLADAYRLKQMLDRQIRDLGEFAGAGTNSTPNMDMPKTAQQARETVNQLKNIAEQEPTRDAFGQPLRDALAGTNKVDLDAKLNQLQQAADRPSQQQRAGEVKDALGKISRAFGESEPKTMQMAHKSDSLKPGEQDSFNLGLSQLESLAKQLGKEQKISPQDQAKQGQEALYNLQTGMRALQGNDDRGNQILLHLDDLLKSKDPIEIEDLRKLLSELQHFSVESSDHLARQDDPEVTNIDPGRLPPAYRGRIQKYFQKLSEK